MFCETCGTVLNVHRLCINCEKNQQERNVDEQENLSAEAIG